MSSNQGLTPTTGLSAMIRLSSTAIKFLRVVRRRVVVTELFDACPFLLH